MRTSHWHIVVRRDGKITEPISNAYKTKKQADIDAAELASTYPSMAHVKWRRVSWWYNKQGDVIDVQPCRDIYNQHMSCKGGTA